MRLNAIFVFNSPASSHMGGAWERLIRTFRSVLNGVLGQSSLDSSSARTVMYEAMSIVNSRPLTVVEDSIEPLTPNHLLHMKSGLVLPPPGSFSDEDVYSRKRWRRVQGLVMEFWNRWRSRYLADLQKRPKWTKQLRNLDVDDIVLMEDAQVSRTQWKLGRVVAVITSHDGRVRRVKVLVHTPGSTKTTVIERPASKLVLLVEATS